MQLFSLLILSGATETICSGYEGSCGTCRMLLSHT